ncbi:YkvI family membrane protein, partial [Proteocatella sphenisci]|uniref:YkvI family membrane protein n=1 Tax=Proteocatella sphenisci TaxID=181070 RepID=UPI0004B3A3EC
MNTQKKNSLVLSFSVASVWFGAHVGGGFATGSQEVNFFVKFGWMSLFLPIIAVIFLGLSYRESLIMARNHETYNYRSWAIKMYEPYDKVFAVLFEMCYLVIVLLGTGGTIAGSAALMQEWGLPYIAGVILTGAIFYILTIFGAGLIRKISSILTIIIFVVLMTLCIVGITANFENLKNIVSTRYQPVSIGKSLYMALKYAGFQSVVIAIILSASDSLKTDRDVNWTIILGVIMNGIMLTLACAMLLSWMPAVENETLPILYICKQLNIAWLYNAYSIVLFAAFVTTGISCIFGAVARFENVFTKPSDIKKRRGIISLIAMIVSMGVSLFGLTKIVQIGYGYLGIVGIFAVILPCIIVGRIKNKRFEIELKKKTVA